MVSAVDRTGRTVAVGGPSLTLAVIHVSLQRVPIVKLSISFMTTHGDGFVSVADSNITTAVAFYAGSYCFNPAYRIHLSIRWP